MIKALASIKPKKSNFSNISDNDKIEKKMRLCNPKSENLASIQKCFILANTAAFEVECLKLN